MKIVVDCLLTLQTQFTPNVGRYNGSDASKRWKLIGERIGSREGSTREVPFQSLSVSSPTSEERRRVVLSESKFQRAVRSPTMAGGASLKNRKSYFCLTISFLKCLGMLFFSCK